jgi:hypothetical protein
MNKKQRTINATRPGLFCMNKNNHCSITDEYYVAGFGIVVAYSIRNLVR